MLRISADEAAKIEKSRLNGNEIIIVRSGANTGDTCVVTDEYRDQYAGYDIIVTLNLEIANPVFFNELMNTHYMQAIIKPLTVRAAQPHINSEQVQNLPMLVVPLQEQEQRDYAQGRIDKDINRVRSRFLQALYRAVTGEPITLDFVYGDIDEEGTMTPLDGQQRLTTLFLLHWYAAKKEKISDDKYAFLSRFSYETRYSARYFCAELVKFMPSFETTLSADIKNQAWFPFDWKDDPTISSMLVMLDAIDERFKDVPDIWEQLENKAITFYFLPIRDMGLTDELYIKMNSRGKPLTVFEHFKAELEREIRALDEKNGQNTADRIVGKIDKSWTDLLWKYRSSGSSDADDNIIDDEFLRYFKFVCDIICYRNGQSPQGYSSDIFDLLHLYFSADEEKAVANIATLEAFFDCWCKINGYDNPTEFLESFMSYTHACGKIVVDSRYKIDIFEDCLHFYSDKSGRIRQFPLNRIVLFVCHNDLFTAPKRSDIF